MNEVTFPDESLDSIGCFLQYLYTREYFPRKKSDTGALEHDPSIPEPDDSGEVLLRHARLYTLAGKLGMPVSASSSQLDMSTSR